MSELDTGEQPNEMTGPYSAEEYGRCAYDHPMNSSGRCEALNANPPACPPVVPDPPEGE